ncbi:hypothetical protein H7849_13960 [Alloacidobacterium dinghuense]|uniref:Uncharacterized protein n=1 Tax=Alloacidobacterium dinghuense TaxID=2763107 RepID=A0A7G8BCL4_9BACT|nr:hypothetical protein [Alloacidobacterium dinghuense]QNI30284.1 hypothetical protein H7849_13960 [Alloacidobacterium dinghuense]
MHIRDEERRNDGAVTRRRFAGSLVAGLAGTLCPIADGQTAKDGEAEANIGLKPDDMSVADWDEVRARYSNVLRVYGQRLSLEEKRKTVEILATNQHMLASIRSFVVQNGDVSACTLRVYDANQPSADKQV